MVTLIETATLPTGEKNESKKEFKSKSVLMKALRRQTPLPNLLLAKLNKNNRVKFKSIDNVTIELSIE